MSKDLFFNFLRSLRSYEEISVTPVQGVFRDRESLHLSCKDSYGRPVRNLTQEERSRFLKEFKKVDNPLYYLPEWADRPFLQEYIIFIEKLRIWKIYLNDQNLRPFMSVEEIIIRSISEGYLFADKLKKIFAFSLRESTGENFHQDECDETFIFEDINQIFPPQHLINFLREKDISDLTSYANKPPVIKSEFTLLREYIRKNIKKGEHLRGFDLFDHIDTMDEKGSFEKGTTTFSEKIKYMPKCNIPDCLRFRINSIQKTPCESRTIAIAEPNCKAFLHYTRSQYTPLLGGKYNYYGKDRWSFEKKLHEKKGFFHFMFDQKKCGWTFPMELIELFFEELCDLYPTIEFKQLYDIFKYKQLYYVIEGSTYTPQRGYTLGMFDDVCSFVIACMSEMFVEHVLEKQKIVELKSIDILIFGDDCDIITECNDITEANFVGSKWLLMLDQHGITVNLSKSYYSKSGVFCEVYGRSKTVQTLKHITYLLNGVSILAAHNTAHAKVLFNSYIRIITTYLYYVPPDHNTILVSLFERIKTLIVSNFPYEFTEKEHLLPFEVGGWYQFIEEGENLLIEKILEGNIHTSFLCVSTVNLPDPESVSKKSQKSFIDSAFEDSVFWKGISAVLERDTGENIMRKKYFNSLIQSKLSSKIWWKYQLNRRKAFLNYEGKLPKSQLIFKYPWHKMKLTEDMFTQVDDELKYICRKKPHFFRHKPWAHFDQRRALDMIKSPDFVGPFMNSRSMCTFTPILDLYSSLDIDLANCKYFIPTWWWELCNQWNIPIEKFYTEMLKKGFDPFIYKPKFYKLGDYKTPLHEIFDLSKEIICWCEKICMFITLSPTDLLYFDGRNLNEDLYNQTFCEILNLSQAELSLYIENLRDNYVPDLERISEEDDLGIPADTTGLVVNIVRPVLEEKTEGPDLSLLAMQGIRVIQSEETTKYFEDLKQGNRLVTEYNPDLFNEDEEYDEPSGDEEHGWDNAGVDEIDILTNKPWLLYNREFKDESDSDEEGIG
jgi:hypothetical protein